jgi:hypothetical protein
MKKRNLWTNFAPICKKHKKKLSYLAWMEYAEKKRQAGERQEQCTVCKRWFFKEEM